MSQRYGINMTINFMESTNENGNIQVRTGYTGANSDNGCRIEFGFDIPEGANKKEMQKFSDNVLRGSAYITIGSTTIDYNYYSGEVVFILKGKNHISLKHDNAPECLREALSDMLMDEDESEDESEDEEGEEPVHTTKVVKKVPTTKKVGAKAVKK